MKVLPPSRGSLDCVVMLFDSPADPRDYPWRITWHAEHHDESTLAFFATDFGNEMVGPGIAPGDLRRRDVPVSAAAHPRHLARPAVRLHRHARRTPARRRLLPLPRAAHRPPRRPSPPAPAGGGWRRSTARSWSTSRWRSFSQETIQQLRMFHVLNGRQVRSYAEHFIRKA